MIGGGLKCSPLTHRLDAREQPLGDQGLDLVSFPLISDTFVRCLDKPGGPQRRE